MIKTTTTYQKTFDQLNEAQRTAVTTTQGPVMVVAGPGTGKTSLLTTRIAYILQQEALQVGPENILCLTFTDAAAGNMRRRLVEMIGEAGARVGVYTYHAFANEALERMPRLNYLREEMEPVSELESRRIVREILGEQPVSSPLRKLHGRLFSEVVRIEELFQTIKTHYIDPQTGRPNHSVLIEKAKAQLEDLDNDSSLFYVRGSKDGKRKAGDPKPTYFSTKARLEKLIAAAGCYPHYEEKLARAGLYDFADMINWVNSEFKDNPDFLADFQERYQYFLVDEYQDTNGSQNELLFSLLTPAFGDENPRPNVLIVGDDDQGIYRFQGADIGNMEAFVSRYPALELVVLTENYRSSQPILDYASRVIAGNADRIIYNEQLLANNPTLSKDLVAKGSANVPNAPAPKILGFENAAQEALALADSVKTLIDAGTNPSEIAILYTKHDFGEEIAPALRERGIPIRLQRKDNVLAQPAVQHLLDILTYVHHESERPGTGGHALFKLIRQPYHSINAPAIEALIAQYTILWYDLKGGARNNSLAVLSDERCQTHLSEEERERFQALLKRVSSAVEKYNRLPLMRFMQWAAEAFGISSFYAAEGQDLDQLQALRGFLDFVQREARTNFKVLRDENARSTKHPAAGAPDAATLLELVQLMAEEEVRLPLQRFEPGVEAVQLMTCYSAKGLEFDHVFVYAVTTQNWEGKKGRNMNQYTLPAGESRHADAVGESDLRRLLYVAMTRARKHLTLSYRQENLEGKTRQPSQYLARMLPEDESIPPATDTFFVPERVQGYLLATLEMQPEHHLTPELLAKLIAHYQLSPSGLNVYLENPRDFLHSQLLRIPQADQPHLAHGNAVHKALERYFQDSVEAWADDSVLIDNYLELVERYSFMFTKKERETYEAWQTAVWPTYLKTMQSKWARKGRNELSLNGVIVEGVPCKGKIDRLEEHADGWVIVDFKSGGYHEKEAKPPSKSPKATDPKTLRGGDYWRQLVFYALMLEADPRYNAKPVKAVCLEFVSPVLEDDQPGRVYIESDADARQTVRQQIREAWAGIQAHAFDSSKLVDQ